MERQHKALDCVESADLQSMYSVLEARAKINLWYERNPVTSNDSEPSSACMLLMVSHHHQKVKQSVTGTSKPESFEEEIDQIFAKLKEKH